MKLRESVGGRLLQKGICFARTVHRMASEGENREVESTRSPGFRPSFLTLCTLLLLCIGLTLLALWFFNSVGWTFGGIVLVFAFWFLAIETDLAPRAIGHLLGRAARKPSIWFVPKR